MKLILIILFKLVFFSKITSFSNFGIFDLLIFRLNELTSKYFFTNFFTDVLLFEPILKLYKPEFKFFFCKNNKTFSKSKLKSHGLFEFGFVKINFFF